MKQGLLKTRAEELIKVFSFKLKKGPLCGSITQFITTIDKDTCKSIQRFFQKDYSSVHTSQLQMRLHFMPDHLMVANNIPDAQEVSLFSLHGHCSIQL